MKRLVIILLSTAAVLLAAAPTAFSAGAAEGEVTVMVMKHACNPDVDNLGDFNDIKASAEGPVAALAATVLACPTIVNPGDDTSDGVKGGERAFSFTLEDANGEHQLPSSTMPSKLCESDLGLDADGDGNVSEDVCLDTTHYVFEGVASGPVTVTETNPPAGYQFGELLFTPTEVDGNNDPESLVALDREAGVIELDTSADNDGSIMLHVYNFETAMPDSAMSAGPENAPTNVGLLIAAGLVSTFAAWFAIGSRRRQHAND